MTRWSVGVECWSEVVKSVSSIAFGTNLDCHGVTTPSSGPPINTKCFKRKKFSRKARNK